MRALCKLLSIDQNHPQVALGTRTGTLDIASIFIDGKLLLIFSRDFSCKSSIRIASLLNFPNSTRLLGLSCGTRGILPQQPTRPNHIPTWIPTASRSKSLDVADKAHCSTLTRLTSFWW